MAYYGDPLADVARITGWPGFIAGVASGCPVQRVYEVGRPIPRRAEEAAWPGPDAPRTVNRKQRRADRARARRPA